MMARWGNADFKQLQELRNRLERYSTPLLDAACRKTAQEIAQVLLNKVKKRTPVGHKPVFRDKDGKIIPKTQKIKSENGRTRSMPTREGEILQRYWSGYVGGTLRDAWKVTGISKQGDKYVIELINPMEYASYVEYGHRQTPGRYVPQLGKSLVGSWVKGRFMLTISQQEVERMAPRMLQQAIENALKEAFK